MRLGDLEFSDLYLGSTFADLKGLKGSSNLRDPIPRDADLIQQLADVRVQCRGIMQAEKDPEFSIVIDGLMFRVTAERELGGKEVFVLRRSTAQLRSIEQVGIAPILVRALMDPALRGLVLLAGETGAGKTSTACSILKARLERVGGIAWAIEDPPEINLNGEHGSGRCVQVRASRRTGGYKEHLVRALRTNPDMILLGEVREEAAAEEVVKAARNGHFIVSTIHAGSPIEAIDQLAALAGGNNTDNAYKALASGLKMVIWQSLRLDRHTGEHVFSYRALPLMEGVWPEFSVTGARAKIAANRVSALIQEMEQVQNLIRVAPVR